jgi:hypothetical protein
MSTGSSDYDVGYRRPPRHSQFRKGQSGNPRGRPKGSQGTARLARRILNEKIPIRENGKRRIITKWEAALKQLANKAAAGDLRAIRELRQLEAEIGRQEAPVAQNGPEREKAVRYVFSWLREPTAGS